MNKYKYTLALVIILVFFAVLFGLYKSSVSANPQFFIRQSLDSNLFATTSVSYMTAGTATSTITVNAYNNGNNTGIGTAALLVQYTASSSTSILDHTVEYSMDNIDWFGEDALPTTFSIGDTTVHHSTTTLTHRWQGDWSNSSTTRKMISYDNIPTRYVRFNFFIPAGATNGAVWFETVQGKEIRR